MSETAPAAPPAAPVAPSLWPLPWTTLLLLATIALLAAGFGLYWLFAGRYAESTEDAYVEGNAVLVTSQVSGTVTAIRADTTDGVRAGDTLLSFNPVDLELALTRARAALGKTVRQVRAQYAQAEQMRASVEQRETELARADADLLRRLQLQQGGAVSGEDIAHARDALRSASAQLAAIRAQYQASAALVDGTTLLRHPDVAAAATQLRDAYVARRRADLPATVGGVVTRRNVQVGQRVAAGTPLMSIVPLDQLWVSANFRESQLSAIRPGQPVHLVADAWGGDVEYRGRVIGIDAGTGSAFSLLPAQNATGNWIKTVQRVPVRIALDPRQLREHPLLVGLSMRVRVDRREQPAPVGAADAGHARQQYRTAVFDAELADADALVAAVIADNLGRDAARHGGR
jgi:membrane fusion protein (multidrug efflux system)